MPTDSFKSEFHTAAQNQANADYYRGLVVKCGEQEIEELLQGDDE